MKKELELQQFATRNKEEVEAEFAMIVELLPTDHEGKQVLSMILAELFHWLFSVKELEHPRPSEFLAELRLAIAKQISGDKNPIKYDA